MAITNSDGSIVLSTKIDIGGIDKALETVRKKFSQLKDQKNVITTLTESLKLQKETVNRLNKEYAELVARGEINSTQAQELKASIKEETSALNQLQDAASTLGVKASKSFDSMSKGAKKFGKRLGGIIKSALIFSVIYRVLQSVVKMLKNVLMSNEEFRQDWEELKAAFYAAAYPIVNLLVPAVNWLVVQVRDWAVSVGKISAMLQGMSYSELVDQAKASKEAADNYAKMEKSSDKTAKNVQKQLASFDEIQILSSQNQNQSVTEYLGFEGLKDYDVSGTKDILSDLMNAVGGALMALGVILLLNGQIAWGIGFIIAGAVGIVAAKLTDESVSQKAKDEISNALIIIGIVAVVIGILCCMGQQWAIGIGLIISGVSIVGYSTAVNWDSIKEKLKEEEFAKWLVVVGMVAVVLGVLLCIANQWGIGLGLIVLGYTGTGLEIVVNWDNIKEKIEETAKDYKSLFIVGSVLMMVLGVALLLTGVGIPWGLAWIAAGAQGVSTGATEDWDFLPNKIKEVWGKVKEFWDSDMSKVFTEVWWLDLAKACGNGLIEGFEAAINSIIGMFENMINWIVDGLNELSFDVPDWVPTIGGETFGFDLGEVSFGRVDIPRLATGTVVPPNKRFLAELGDNTKEHEIVSPVSTMKQAFMEAMLELGGTFGGGNNIEVVLEVDGQEFGRAVVEQGNRESRRIGTRLVVV